MFVNGLADNDQLQGLEKLLRVQSDGIDACRKVTQPELKTVRAGFQNAQVLRDDRLSARRLSQDARRCALAQRELQLRGIVRRVGRQDGRGQQRRGRLFGGQMMNLSTESG